MRDGDGEWGLRTGRASIDSAQGQVYYLGTKYLDQVGAESGNRTTTLTLHRPSALDPYAARENIEDACG